MAWIAAIAGAVIDADGQRQGAEATRQAADRKQQTANIEAAHMEQQGQQTVAAAQRQMLEERKQARLLESRALAVAAASGAGASDTTVMNVISRIAAEGAYRSTIALYEGQEQSRQLQIGGHIRREGGDLQADYGRQAARAQEISAVGTLFKGGATLYERYGNKKQPSDRLSGGNYLDAGSEPAGTYA